MSALVFIVLAVVAFASAEAVYYCVRYLGERPAEELKRRLRTVGTPTAGIQLLRRRRLASSPALSELLSGFEVVARVEKLLDQTDLDQTVASLLFSMLALGTLAASVAVVAHQALIALVVGPLFGAMPLLAVFRSRASRAKMVSEQLPDTLDMMARAVKAGHALPASFKLVAQECPPPIAVEFAKVYEQQNLGLSIEAAVHNMTDRVPSNLDLKLLAVSVTIQKETGGNLVEMLENIAGTMRERFKFFSKLRALTAEGRISGIILGSLPIVVAVLIAITNAAYIAELGHGMGLRILAGGVTLWVVGVLWIRSLMKVNY